MWRRFLGYGFVGWALEVSFTALTDGVSLRDRRLKGHSYLWMLPIYGAGGLLLEQLHHHLRARSVPRWGRSLAYMAGIYSIELGSAALLSRVIGEVPWRYRRGINVRGYVRIDYAPFWYLCGWLFESLESELRKMGRPSRKTWRPRLSAPAADAAAPRRSFPTAPAQAAARP
ncbi:MAG: hypothetical protein E6J78_12470 [Deltaproteobacteria bacterium]|nr:MAG: hypothetical protein E6J78_12470 [Deltaproteobacteria bacterium]